MVAVEYPAPFLKGTMFSRSIMVRIMMLLVQSVLAILYYQVSCGLYFIFGYVSDYSQGTNGGIWSIIAMVCYIRAQMLGEKMEEAKENRGRGGRA